MADNFRNKQWFKNMSQERKDEICKNFDIDEKTLRKCGRETDDGRIVIDLLRIDHLIHYPEEWDIVNNAIKDHILDYKDLLKECSPADDLIGIFENLYNLFGEHSYLKYKDTLHNKVLMDQTYKCLVNDIDGYIECDEDNYKAYFAHKIYTHLKVLLKTDLNIIK